MADHAVPGAIRAEYGLDIRGLGGDFVAMVWVIERRNERSRAVRLVVDHQYCTRLSHISSAVATAGDASEFFLVPVIVKLGEVVFYRAAGLEHRAILQIHVAIKHVAVAGHDLLGVQ